jgi:hypothetical protein
MTIRLGGAWHAMLVMAVMMSVAATLLRPKGPGSEGADEERKLKGESHDVASSPLAGGFRAAAQIIRLWRKPRQGKWQARRSNSGNRLGLGQQSA